MGKLKKAGVGPKAQSGRSPGGRGERAAPRLGSRHKYVRPQSYETKRKAVQLYVEEGVPSTVVAREVGVWKGTIFDWARQYREHGEEGLRPKGHGHRPVNPGRSVVAANARALIRAEITTLKQKHPDFGVRRIAQTLRRIFHLPACPETVRQTLHQAKLISPSKKKQRRNPSKPRFFERSTPNQLWQSDIFPFKLNGEAVRPADWLGPGGYAYLIGFIDDHSRYITALDVFRSQTADNVLEVYRRGVGAYGLPKEMLTDNGRQYTNWRGKTAFEKELAKGRVHHLRSQPHHPQTLGKIERFWKTIYEEFLVRARFTTFEEARERIKWWVQYYNHKRPHQGIEGLCPADRFYRIQAAVRTEIEKGIVQNVQDLALHGKRQPPFYMVGRLGEQSVTIRQEDGHVKLMVEQAEGGQHESGKYGSENAQSAADLQRAGEGGGGVGIVERTAEPLAARAGTGVELGHAEQLVAERPAGDDQGVGGRATAGEPAGGTGPAVGGTAGGPAALGAAPAASAVGGATRHPPAESNIRDLQPIEEKDYADNGTETQIQRAGTVPGGAAGVVGAQECDGGVPGVADQQRAAESVAGAGHGGPAGGSGTAGGPVGARETPGAVGVAEAATGEKGVTARESGPAAWSTDARGPAPAAAGGAGSGGPQGGLSADDADRGRTLGPDAAGHAGGNSAVAGRRCGAPDGGLPPDVLPVGDARVAGDGCGDDTPAGGPAGGDSGPGARRTAGAERAAPAGERGSQTTLAGPGVAA